MKILYKTLISFIILLPIFSIAHADEMSCSELSEKQIDILVQSHRLGAPFGLSYSLSAIAWQESHAGEWKINIQDPSFGVYHLNINTIMHHAKSMGVKDTNFRRNMMAQKVMDDTPFSAAIAIQELLFWHNFRDNGWIETWASYNGGTRGIKIKSALSYAHKIKEIIKNLKGCHRFQRKLYEENLKSFKERWTVTSVSELLKTRLD